ncbi:MAG: type II secretion system F family protein [Armatimonadetes bacterium]|nr:type II secretion system F family protein [Armatimonadota bacterium]
MPTFQYQALNPEGEAISGIVFGTSLDNAMGDLLKRGLNIQSIGVATALGDPLANQPAYRPDSSAAVVSDPVESPTEYGNEYIIDGRGGKIDASVSVTKSVAEGIESYSGHEGAKKGPPTHQRNYVATSVVGPIAGKVSLANLAFFFNQLGTMMKAGVPMVQSLDTLSDQARDPRFKHVIKEMVGHVEAGRPMTAGMQRYPEIFSPVMLSIIRTGEEGGFLDEALFTVAKYTEDEIELRNLYRRVTIYPKLLIIASIIIIVGANAVIHFLAPGAKGLSSPLTNISTWYILTPIIIGLFLFFRVGLANFGIKYMWDMFISLVPFLGKTIRQMAMAKFGRAFGALYKAGVPLPRVVKLAADSCGNEYLRSKLYPASNVLEGGAGITETLASTGALSPIVVDMLSTGERTGNLDHMLNKMSDYYHDEAKTRSVQLGQFVGVVVLLMAAIYIAYVIITFYQSYGSQVTNQINQ